MKSCLRIPLGVVLAALPLAKASAQRLGGGASPNVSLIRVAAALLFCLTVAILAAIWLRRRDLPKRINGRPFATWAAGLRQERRIEIIEARRLSVHADLCLARCDEIEYLLVCGPGETKVISSRPRRSIEAEPVQGSGA